MSAHHDPRPAEHAPAHWFRRLVPYALAPRREVILASLAAVSGVAAATAVPLLQMTLVDDVIVNRRRPLLPWAAALLAMALLGSVSAFVRRDMGAAVGLRVQYDLREALYSRLQRLDFTRHDELRVGDLVSRAGSDIGLLQAMMAFFPMMAANVVGFAVAVVVMLTLSLPLTLVVLLAIPLVGITAARMRTDVFPAAWDAQRRAADVAAVVEEAVAGVRVVKAFGQEDREVRRLVQAARTLFAARIRLVTLQARYSALLQAVPGLGQGAMLAAGGYLVLRGHITIGTFVAFSAYFMQLLVPARMFAVFLVFTQQARAGAARIFEILDAEPVVSDTPGAVDLRQAHGDIRFDDVWFGYEPDEPVLRGLSLHIRPGERVAFVGRSGSGKSTLALLIARFYDVQRGCVAIDGTDVRHLSLDSLRRHVRVVFDDSFLFSRSIRDNIAFGRDEATDEEVRAAAEAAGVDEFVERLPNGYDTIVGERGLTLSGGQRQRMALARALLTDPTVLVLDDATSALDARVEREVHRALTARLAGRTTLLVAHRRSTLRLAERIVVVDEGRVLDQGTHDDLQSRCSLYRRLLDGGPDAGDDDALAEDAAGTAPAPVPAAVGAGAASAVVAGSVRSRGDSGGAGGQWWADLPPPGDLADRLAAMPVVDDDPHVDLDRETAHDAGFSLRRFLRPFTRPLLLGVVLVVVESLVGLAGPALVGRGMDAGLGNRSLPTLLFVSAVLLGVVALGALNSWFQSLHMGRTAERLLFALRVRIFAHLQRLSLDYYDNEMAGRILTRITADVEALAGLLQSGLVSAVVSLVALVGVAVVLVIMSPPLAAATLAVFPALVVLTVWFRRRSNLAYDIARERVAAVNAGFQEGLSGVRVVQAYGQEARHEEEFRSLAAAHLDARRRTQRLVAVYFPAVQLLHEVAVVVVLAVGAGLVQDGRATPGILLAFLLYLGQLFAPIQQLSQVFDSYQQARASTTRIAELMRTPTGTPEAAGAVELHDLQGHLRFEDVRLRYPGATHDALAGVTLDIASGQSVALVGRTGAGKSTLVKLVARFYDPTGGRILVDGVPLSQIALGPYRRRLGFVPQEPFLFSGTIRDNIAYGRPDATDEEVEAAARAVGAHDAVTRLPGGYSHVVAERGRSLSAGQRQLVALARAQLVDVSILLLDEATSSLDMVTEARIRSALRLLARDRTTLVIAHRLETAATADRILVVDEGRIVEDGTHEELLDAGGPYADLWDAQRDLRDRQPPQPRAN